jgi:hypothetical protein
MKGNSKYRPYFTASELLEVIGALKEHPTPSRLALIRYLEGFSIKITTGVQSPNLTLAPSLEQKLEFVPRQEQEDESFIYSKWRNHPKICTPRELKTAMDYAYRNDLLTPKEEEEYEHSQLSQF